MRKPEIDYILTKMLESNTNISDVILTVDKPFQVEASGILVPVELEPHFGETDTVSDGNICPESG